MLKNFLIFLLMIFSSHNLCFAKYHFDFCELPFHAEYQLYRERSSLPYKSLSEYFAYIAKKGNSEEINRLINWAKNHYDFLFNFLFDNDVVPLDPTWFQGEIITVAEAVKWTIENFTPYKLLADGRIMHATLKEELISLATLLTQGLDSARLLRGSSAFPSLLWENKARLLVHFRASEALKLLRQIEWGKDIRPMQEHF